MQFEDCFGSRACDFLANHEVIWTGNILKPPVSDFLGPYNILVRVFAFLLCFCLFVFYIFSTVHILWGFFVLICFVLFLFFTVHSSPLTMTQVPIQVSHNILPSDHLSPSAQCPKLTMITVPIQVLIGLFSPSTQWQTLIMITVSVKVPDGQHSPL